MTKSELVPSFSWDAEYLLTSCIQFGKCEIDRAFEFRFPSPTCQFVSRGVERGENEGGVSGGVRMEREGEVER